MVLKTKTKSNQSNDRQNEDDGASGVSDEGGVTHQDDWQSSDARTGPRQSSALDGARGDGTAGEYVTAVGDEGQANLNGLPPGQAAMPGIGRAPGGVWQGENSIAGGEPLGGDDDEGPSTLLDLSGSADGDEVMGVGDIDLDGLPDVDAIDLELLVSDS